MCSSVAALASCMDYLRISSYKSQQIENLQNGETENDFVYQLCDERKDNCKIAYYSISKRTGFLLVPPKGEYWYSPSYNKTNKSIYFLAMEQTSKTEKSFLTGKLVNFDIISQELKYFGFPLGYYTSLHVDKKAEYAYAVGQKKIFQISKNYADKNILQFDLKKNQQKSLFQNAATKLEIIAVGDEAVYFCGDGFSTRTKSSDMYDLEEKEFIGGGFKLQLDNNEIKKLEIDHQKSSETEQLCFEIDQDENQFHVEGSNVSGPYKHIDNHWELVLYENGARDILLSGGDYIAIGEFSNLYENIILVIREKTILREKKTSVVEHYVLDLKTRSLKHLHLPTDFSAYEQVNPL